jgi:hypothetical protein
MFIYTSSININHENAFGLLKLTDEFGVTSVKEKCIQCVKQLVTEENIFEVFEEARFYGFNELVQFCQMYLETNAKTMFATER